MAGNVFNRIGALHPRRSAHDLSHRILTTTDMGILYPITSFLVTAGDYFKIANELVIRLQPCFAPVLHVITAFVHWFFVPLRIVWSAWEEYRTGGQDGKGHERNPLPLIYFDPFVGNQAELAPAFTKNGVMNALYHFHGKAGDSTSAVSSLLGNAPVDFLLRAYTKIYNDYYRDENFISPYPMPTDYNRFKDPYKGFFYRAWRGDYFTKALPDQQLGTPPAFPISNITGGVTFTGPYNDQYEVPSGYPSLSVVNPTGNDPFLASSTPQGAAPQGSSLVKWLQQNNFNLLHGVTFDVTDLRMAVQIQKYLERNQRGGFRYTEWLRSRFAVSPTDARLDRPEYIGGSKSPVIVSEVLQTSSSPSSDPGTPSGTPQGNMAGHGLTADNGYIGRYTCKEDGVIMAILSVMPEPMYMQGLDKQWIKRNRFEFILPEFVHVSEKAVETVEIYSRATSPHQFPGGVGAVYNDNTSIFGYQGMYDEFRYMRSWFGGDFCLINYGTTIQMNLSYWHLGRFFAAKPYLNRSFIECSPDSTKRIFNVQTVHGLMVSFGARVTAVRPIPFIAEPGLIDHF